MFNRLYGYVPVKEELAEEFISKYHLRAASSVSALLKKLINNELIYQTDEGYIMNNCFMGEWLRNQLFW